MGGYREEHSPGAGATRGDTGLSPQAGPGHSSAPPGWATQREAKAGPEQCPPPGLPREQSLTMAASPPCALFSGGCCAAVSLPPGQSSRSAARLPITPRDSTTGLRVSAVVLGPERPPVAPALTPLPAAACHPHARAGPLAWPLTEHAAQGLAPHRPRHFHVPLPPPPPSLGVFITGSAHLKALR